MEAPQKYAQLTRDVGALLEDGIGRDLLSKLVEAPKSDHHLLLDKDISAFFSKYYQLRKRHQEAHLTCAVLALTKSGEWSTALADTVGPRISLPLVASDVPISWTCLWVGAGRLGLVLIAYVS